MNMLDPFDPMSPFFQDEFIFNEENDSHRRRREGDDCCQQPCPDCGEILKFRSGAETVRCRNCGSRFRVN